MAIKATRASFPKGTESTAKQPFNIDISSSHKHKTGRDRYASTDTEDTESPEVYYPSTYVRPTGTVGQGFDMSLGSSNTHNGGRSASSAIADQLKAAGTKTKTPRAKGGGGSW